MLGRPLGAYMDIDAVMAARSDLVEVVLAASL